MSTPAIQYSGPVISPEVPWETRRHLQLIYQKLGNHVQGISLLSQKVNKLTPGGGTTTVIEGSLGGGGSVSGTGISVNNQSGVTSYSTVSGDLETIIILDDASPVAVTLTTQTPPWSCWITNLGAGTATLTPQSGTINGGASFALLQNTTAIIAFDGTDWWAGSSPIVPVNTPGVAHEWIASYNSTTGVFTLSQPAFSDISGNLATSQLPTAGLSVTIITAALTGGGTQGSMTFTNGILTAQVPAT
jgi:hypothetical protein